MRQNDRDRIQSLLDAGVEQKEIARILGRDPGTISREINRNSRQTKVSGGKLRGEYEAEVAGQKAYVTRKYAKWAWKKINEDNNLREYIENELMHFQSPDGISGKMKLEHQPFYASKTAIYEWLYSNRGQWLCPFLYGMQYRPRKHREKKTERVMIPNRIGLDERPEGANNRTRYRHWEGDTLGRTKHLPGTVGLEVVYERKAKYIEAEKIESLSPEHFNLGMKKIQERVATMRSLTFDNGMENRGHELLGVPTFFCDSYSSWQKGGVENANKMLRRFFPKGTNFRDVTENDVRLVIGILNNKARKSLGYKSAKQVMEKRDLLVKSYSEPVALRG
ncbi:MAG: IS30 family transposase [Patescibacteria group bacterium]